MEGIPKILNNLDIPARNFSAAQCWRTDHRTTRIIISVQVEGEEIAMWRKAAKMIYTVFEAGCLPDVQVQISNPARYQCHLISRDPPPPEAAAIFDSVTDNLFRVVIGLGNRCEGFGLYMSGNLDDLNPTVVIFVKEQAEFDWITFVRTCKSVIGSSYLAVRIQPGLLRLGAAENGYSSTWAQELHREPRNGSSIGTKGNEVAGTLGAFVILEFPTANVMCGLTCQHVVTPACTKLASQIYRNGLGDDQFKASEAGTIVQYPSRIDLEASVKRLTSYVTDLEADISTMPPHKIRHLEKKRQELAVAKELEAIDLDLGKVRYSSGLRNGASKVGKSDGLEWCTREECKSFDHGRVDWAVFDIPKHLFTTNKAPADMEIKPPALNYSVGKNFTISEIAPIEPTTWVCKVGRATGVTTGWVGAYRHFSRWVDEYAKDDGTTDVFVSWSKDWIVFPHELTGSVAMGHFGMPGDSGSCLVDENGRMVAVLTGICIDSGGQAITIVKDITTIFADIEAKVGCKVRLSRSSDLGLIDQLTNLVKGMIDWQWW